MLTGCGGSQPPIGAPGVVTQPATTDTRARRATSGDLIYATGGCGGTCVISYPSGQFVGSLPVGKKNSSGVCLDSQNNVYISNDTSVLEYAHGGTTPINTFNLPGGGAGALGCAIDPTTGNLAVAFGSQTANIAIFAPGGGTSATYSAGMSAIACGYDDQGNLFVAGYNGQAYGLAELPVGSGTFFVLQINGMVGRPGQVQFDGQFVAYQGTSKGKAMVSQLSISGFTATVVNQIPLQGIQGNSYASWISNGNILVPFAKHGRFANKIGVWKYPAGGKRSELYRHFTKPRPTFYAVILSSAPRR